MGKYSFLSGILFLILFGCSSTRDLSDLSPEERLQYALNLYNDEDYQNAAIEFEAILLQYPGSVYVDDAQFYLGMCRFQREEYILSAFEFSKLIKNMPASEFVADAQFMLADSYYRLSPNYTLDQRYTRKAIEEFQVFIDFFPLNQRVAEAERKIAEMNDKLAKKEYSIAVIYEKMNYYTASLKYYDAVIETFHDTQYAPMASYRKIKLLMEREREDEALAEMRKFVRLYPEDKNFREIDNLKNSLESKLKGGFSSN